MTDDILNNSSTILVGIYAIIAPFIGPYLNQEAFVAICGLILVIISAYYPNTFKILGNQEKSCEEGENDTSQ